MAAIGVYAYCPPMPHPGSGWSELDDAMAEWTAATGALPPVFRTELLDTLEAVEHGTLTLVWSSGTDAREAVVEGFPHPFSRALDGAMLYLCLSLGLSGPRVRMDPIGGLILRRHLGGAEGPVASTEDADPAELAQLRASLASVIADDAPDGGTDDEAI